MTGEGEGRRMATPMELHVGTSGYSYKEWKGSFYPEDLPAKEMLRFYASRLPAVEINNTFYRLPKASVLETWAEQVPEGFRFAIKASRRITHLKRLKGAEDETTYLLDTVETLGPRTVEAADATRCEHPDRNLRSPAAHQRPGNRRARRAAPGHDRRQIRR